MSNGPGFYRIEYKDYSDNELKIELKRLKKYLRSKELKKIRKDEIINKVDDNNSITNVETAIKVVKELLKECDMKKRYVSIPAQEENIEQISVMLNMSVSNVKMYSKRIDKIKATYYYNPGVNGKSVILGDDGSYLLTILHSTKFKQLLKKYKKGDRNGKFTITLQDIISLYITTGVTTNLVKNLDDFTNKIIKSNNEADLFWTDSAKNLFKLLLLADLLNKDEATIELLIEQTKIADNTKNAILNNLEKLDIPELKTYMISISILNDDVLLKSIVEIIYNSLIQYTESSK